MKIRKAKKEDIEKLWPLEIESSRYHEKIIGRICSTENFKYYIN